MVIGPKAFEERNRLLGNSASLGIFTTDTQGRITGLNKKMREMLPWPSEHDGVSLKIADYRPVVGSDRSTQKGPKGSWRSLFRSNSSVAKFIEETLKESRVVRRYTKIDSSPDGFSKELETEITCSPFNIGARPNDLLIFNEMGSMDDIKGLIPICSVCHKIIDEKETIARIEALAQEYESLQFSHGLCAKYFKIEMAKVENYPGANTPDGIPHQGKPLW